MLIGALGAGAISQIADALTTPTPTTTQTRFRTPDIGNADATAASTQSLTTPEPPDGKTAISKAAAKLVTDLKSPLLSVQADQSQSNPGAPIVGQKSPTAAAATVATTA